MKDNNSVSLLTEKYDFLVILVSTHISHLSQLFKSKSCIKSRDYIFFIDETSTCPNLECHNEMGLII